MSIAIVEALHNAVVGALAIGTGLVTCSLTRMEEPHFRTDVAADDVAVDLDQRQYDRFAGPCVAAVREGALQLVEEVIVLSRTNPDFVDTAARNGVRSVLPMPVPAVRPSVGHREAEAIRNAMR